MPMQTTVLFEDFDLIQERVLIEFADGHEKARLGGWIVFLHELLHDDEVRNLCGFPINAPEAQVGWIEQKAQPLFDGGLMLRGRIREWDVVFRIRSKAFARPAPRNGL